MISSHDRQSYKGFRKGKGHPHLAGLADTSTIPEQLPQEAGTTTEAYKGVSKGEGTHCKRCKSRFHDEKDCPTLKREQASHKQATPKARAKQARLVTSVFDALPNRTFASPTAEQTTLSVAEESEEAGLELLSLVVSVAALLSAGVA